MSVVSDLIDEADLLDRSDEVITTDDILEVLDEMGLAIDNQEDIDRLIEAVIDLEENPGNDTIFMGHVEIEPQVGQQIASSSSPAVRYSSPLHPRYRRKPDAASTDEFLPLPRPRVDADHIEISTHPEADYWVARAYDRMAHVYAQIREMDEELARPIDQWKAGTAASSNEESNSPEENKENVGTEGKARDVMAQTAHGRFPVSKPVCGRLPSLRSAPSLSSGSDSGAITGSSNNVPRKLSAKELGLRQVHDPEPGRLPLRFDPVQRWELARSEWSRNPPPHEKKRLALRWKVREYMLRQDMPSFDPRNPSRPVVHPKDWSPRPYLP